MMTYSDLYESIYGKLMEGFDGVLIDSRCDLVQPEEDIIDLTFQEIVD